MSPTATIPSLLPTLISKMTLTLPPMDFIFPFIGLITAYHLLAPYYPTSKKRAWLLTACASCVMTGASLPFIVDFVRSKADLGMIRGAPFWAVLVNRFFQAYLASDLLMGSIYYRKYVTWTMGWAHHAIYICIVELCIRKGWSHIFCLSAFMELPTFLLAIATLHPILRNNTLFALTFFGTRILLHLTLIALFVLPSGRAVVDGAWAPSVLLTLAFPMHCVWFTGSVKGFIKRHKERKAAKISVDSNVPVVVSDSESPTDEVKTSGDVSISMTDVTQSSEPHRSPRSSSADLPALLTSEDFIAPHARTEPPSPSSPTTISAPIVTISSALNSEASSSSLSEPFITLRLRRPLPLRVQQLLPSRFRNHPTSSPLAVDPSSFDETSFPSLNLDMDMDIDSRDRFRTLPIPARRQRWKMIYDRMPALPIPPLPRVAAREKLYRYVGLGRGIEVEDVGVGVGVMPGSLGIEKADSVMGRSVRAF